MKTRLHFLDNLRTSMIFLVVLLHAGIVYEPILENTWIVSDPVKNSSIGLIRMYLDLFIMFMLFYISGYFVPYALKTKTAGKFILSKFNRLIVPWAIACITLIPLYKAIYLYSRGLPQQEWYTYFHIYQQAGSDLSNFANNPTQSWLWFLPVLFMFQLIYLGMAKSKLLNFKISLKTGVILTFVIGLAYSLIISAIDMRGWFHSPLLHFQKERLLVYFMVFLLGSLSYKLKVFASEKKNKKYFIISNVVLTLSLTAFTAFALNLFFNMIDPGRNYFFVSEIIDRIAYYVFMLLSILSFLHILLHSFRFSLNKVNKLMQILNNNSYHVYLIHLVVLGAFALLMVNVRIPAFIKFLLLGVITFITSNALIYLYHMAFKQRTYLKIAALTSFVFILFSAITFDNDKGSDQQVLKEKPSIGIHEAALIGDMNAIKQHIQWGSDLNEKDQAAGSSPLITAAAFGKTDVVNALIEAGADVNFQNNDGSTPIHTASFFCHTEIIKILLDNGADKNIRNKNGSTAMETAALPFDVVKVAYDYFAETLGPLGMELDYNQIIKTRPLIVEMLK